MILKRLLELQHHSVRTCATAAEAKAALTADGAERYDLLVCDLMLPDGEGYDVMRRGRPGRRAGRGAERALRGGARPGT